MIKVILAAIGTLFVTVIGVLVFFVWSKGDGEVASVAPTPEVTAERQAPATLANPMTPVTEEEAARRSELHAEIVDSNSDGRSGVMAPPVVTEVVSANADDPMSRELFGDIFFPTTPEPQGELPQKEEEPVAAEPEEEPTDFDKFVEEAEDAGEQVVETVERRVIDPTLHRERFRVDSSRPGTAFGVHNFGGYAGPRDFGEDGAMLRGPAMMELLGLEPDYFAKDEEGWFEPYQVADGLGGGLSDPVVVPRAQYNLGTQQITGYGAPLAEQRSAARPAMVGVDPFGQTFTTSNAPNPFVDASNGSVVLARGGDIITASLLYGFNSDDVRGLPIYATINDFLPNGAIGPLNGARAKGQVAYSNDNAAIIFEEIRLANGREFAISAIAVSLDSGRPGVAEKVNRHTLARYGSLFAAGLIEGIGEVAQIRLINDGQGDNVIINEGSGTVNVTTDEPSNGEIAAGALAPVGRQLSRAAARGFNRPPTITASAGLPFAMVFTQTVVSDPATARTAFNPRTNQVEVVGSVEPLEGQTFQIGGTAGPQQNATLPTNEPQAGSQFVPLGQGQNFGGQ